MKAKAQSTYGQADFQKDPGCPKPPVVTGRDSHSGAGTFLRMQDYVSGFWLSETLVQGFKHLTLVTISLNLFGQCYTYGSLLRQQERTGRADKSSVAIIRRVINLMNRNPESLQRLALGPIMSRGELKMGTMAAFSKSCTSGKETEVRTEVLRRRRSFIHPSTEASIKCLSMPLTA